MKIAISFLKSNYDFNTTIQMIEKSKANYVHVDVCDGLFVNAKTKFTKEMLETLKKCTTPKDVHLMTLHLEDYIELFSKINPEYITFHYESTANHEEIIKFIKEKYIKVGIAINPITSVNSLKPYLPLVDQVLVMSVTPGYGGQKFMKQSIAKVKELDKIRTKNNYSYQISIDGGINEETAKMLKNTGIDMLVSGSYVCFSNDFDTQISKLV